MPLLLRTVEKHHRWFKAQAQPFLENNDVPADPLVDLKTTDNKLSIWILAEDRSNIERVVCAVASGRQQLDQAAYVIFDSKILDETGIEIENIIGITGDTEANGWHRDIVLSGNKMVALVKGMLRDGEDVSLILKGKMKELMKEGISSGRLPESLRTKFKLDT